VVTRDRERSITTALVSLTSHLVGQLDVVDLLTELTADCERLLDVASAGLLLADGRGVLHVLAASSERTRSLELLQLQRDEGPCLDSYHGHAPVLVPDLRRERERWPHFVDAATEAGFVSVHALPMRLRDRPLGTLGLFGTEVGSLNADDLSLAQAMADVASIALIANQAADDQAVLTKTLQGALSSRVVIEQAKGLLAQLGGLEMPEAFAVLRRYARDHNRRFHDVADHLVSRQLDAASVLTDARARPGRG